MENETPEIMMNSLYFPIEDTFSSIFLKNIEKLLVLHKKKHFKFNNQILTRNWRKCTI